MSISDWLRDIANRYGSVSREYVFGVQRCTVPEREIEALIARVEKAEEKAARLEKLLDELRSSVHEQQHTLESMGWNNAATEVPSVFRPGAFVKRKDKCNDWTKAGAVRHQFDRIEAVLAAVDAAGDLKEGVA